ncbi:hypothetical protein ACLVXC_004719 [Vibrio alginolyticus]|uniref:hypothetical protein n=1 Tax=Gammaproteobacteria TaxID=1236 RepID=UPI00034DA6F9|nr:MULTISPECIES: hypothetical protein [Gammaproteobacteria]ELA9205232.1 hypothetical protein [Vibrio alginolyticus]MCA0767886.1 hypothetical protein [Vibrio vulnificus]MCC9654093.1 hypothetical protein [Vibrio sp. MA64]MCG9740116.1 hypothetical protein [Shewanella insulae]MDT9658809.1 hypothetical protein [Vibrio vulnificus]
MNEWTFEFEDYEYKINPRSIEFVGELDGDRYVFRVLASTLNDYFETDDDRESAINNYLENMDNIHSAAESVASEYDPNDEIPNYYLDEEDLAEFC